MRKTITIFCLFFVCIFLSIITHLDCKNKCYEITTKTNTIENQIEKREKVNILAEIKNLEHIWEKNEKILRIYMKRKNLETIEKQIINLKTSIETSNVNEIKKYLKQIKRLCNDCIKETKPYLSNIL